MRKNGLIGIVALFIIALNSCLGDGGDRIWVQLQPAVYTTANNTPVMVLSNGEYIYSDRFNNTLSERECFLVEFVIDYDNPENGDSTNINGYYTVEDFNSVELRKERVSPELTDTINKIDDNEFLIQGIQGRSTIILNQLFLYTQHSVSDSIFRYQPSFDLSYGEWVPQENIGGDDNNEDEDDNGDEEEETEEQKIITTAANANSEGIFEMYLRATKSSTASTVNNPLGSNVNTIYLTAFDISQFLNEIGAKATTDTVKFVIKYPSVFQGDSIVSKWATSATYFMVKDN